ncbi:putative general amino-acid permease GAP1 [Talaromyces proteolyticus]|uniref:General amino-acid permease GAP1 n=1 Tax=Talaromyces proteolyticus TaxID=1131652 RepID=A0AAD4KGU0_9EURO|nr:putative general amino-acid permease GAP1 [Talaromyces proteolyticus]KAH8691405.1 putative general amino-acid permease GAP1 [Talaromyces proteolyticus]
MAVSEPEDIEKKGAGVVEPVSDSPAPYDDVITTYAPIIENTSPLKRSLKNRHMQMIAIGGAIGAGLFVGTGGALQEGGPGSVLLGYLIVGGMLLMTIQALSELAVLYPVNGAFFTYCCRFIDPAWGFAVGWDYAIGWLVILPFEITAAGITIEFWRSDLNIGIWITVFLVVLSTIQIFGVRGYGEVEFVLSVIKVTALFGFIILGIVIDCGGAPVGGYIGGHYWFDPGAFTDFRGFCSVFVTAAFAFGGTEMSGLAAAEAANPAKSIPKATKQVFWRITIFYVVGTLIVGLIVPSNADYLMGSTGANTKASPFVVSIQNAGISGLPSVMNAVITISVISVANSATFGSSRTIQALAAHGMAPSFMAYVDKAGRPLYCVLLQIAFGFLAFINEASTGGQIFTWLLALSGISNFFIWGSICLAHIRFRAAWKHHGHDVKELAYTAPFGVIGSYIGLSLNVICLIAEFYVSVAPKDAQAFFENYIAAPLVIGLYLLWKLYSVYHKDPRINHRGWKPFLKVEEMDILSGMRDGALDVDLPPRVEYATRGEWLKAAPMRLLHSLY